MNQTFSISRFERLLRKYFTDNRGQLLANLGLVTGLLLATILVFYTGLPEEVDRNRRVPFFFIGWAAWYVFIWQQTEDINQKERAMNYLLQPASQFEKILLIWLVSGLGFVLIYFCLFGLIDGLGVSYVNHKHWTPEQQKLIGSFRLVPCYSSNTLLTTPSIVWVFSALLHPFALAFSLLIRRYTLPLVAVLTLGLLAVSLFLNTSILRGLLGTNSIFTSIPFTDIGTESPLNRYEYRNVTVPQPLGNQIRYLVAIAVVILLYVMAYVRLKEREV